MTAGDSEVLVRLVVEHWKVLRAFERTVVRLPAEHRNRSAAQLNYSLGVLEGLVKEAGLRIVTLDGQAYTANMPATAVNAEDFVEGSSLLVEQTVEPALVRDMTVVHFGRVLVGLPRTHQGGTAGPVHADQNAPGQGEGQQPETEPGAMQGAPGVPVGAAAGDTVTGEGDGNVSRD